MTWSIAPAMLENTAFRPKSGGEGFEIDIPPRANIAADMLTPHATGARGERIAAIFERPDGVQERLTFRDLEEQATRLASVLRALDVGRGDRVAIHSVQRPETIVAHLATYKLGAVATTVSQVAGADTMAHILADSGARVVITHDAAWERFRRDRGAYRTVEHLIVAGRAIDPEIVFADCTAAADRGFRPAVTGPEDPALLIYTSGSTGKPKGILHGHRLFHALNASLELFYNLELREQGLVFWTAADWARVGDLNDVVFPSRTFGHTLIVTEHHYDPEWALGFMARHGVTHTLLTPTALKRLALAARSSACPRLALRTIFTGGEPLPGETHQILPEELGVICNEGYGMTEVNQMIGNCQRLRPVRPGSMGWQFPGRHVRLVDEDGVDVSDGEVGEIVVSAEDPTLFLGYWRQPEQTAALYLTDGWVRTHDLACRDGDGYFWYQGRNDDLIKSAGFRIGPAEIEDVLLLHPAIADAGVIGVPDPDGQRGMLIKACVVRSGAGCGGGDDTELAEELRLLVKARLGPHKQPRVVEFLEALPTTSSGKINRAELRRQHAARASEAAW